MNKLVRPAINGALISALFLLSGCKFFPSKECATCGPTQAGEGKVLLTINGKEKVHESDFEEFYKTWLEGRKDGAFAALDPASRRNAFNDLEMMHLIAEEVKASGKDKDPKYLKNKKLAQTYIDFQLNQDVVANEILNSIDTSDAALETFYNENKGKHPALDNPMFLKSPEGIKVQGVDFTDEKSAKEFLAKAQKGDFAGLAKAIKKDVKDLGIVSPSSRMVDFAVRTAARSLQPNEVKVVTLQNGQFMVIKGVGARQSAQYVDFASIKDDAPKKEMLSNIVKQTQLQSKFMEYLENIKKKFNVVENTTYFEEEEAKKKAELEAKLKEFQEAREENKAEAPKAA